MNVLIPIFIGLSVSAQAPPAPPASKPAPVPTWSAVAPILHRHCAVCHRAGEVAPFPLLDYEDARKRARQIAEVTRLRFMPPWKVTAPHNAFIGERRMSESEIRILARWASAGAPRGSRAAPPRPPFPEPARPDLVVTMPEPFAVPADGPDVYRCIAIPIHQSANRWVRAVDFRPGNRRVVHHALIFAGKPESKNYPCFGAPGFVPARGLGGWSPGNGPFSFPSGTGALLPAGHDLVLQIHYHPSGVAEMDQSSVGLYFSDTPPSRTLMDIALGSNRIDIPAGEAGYRVTDHFTLPVDVDLLGVIPHMHYVGKRVRGWAGTQLLFEIRDWDFNWQDRYWYRQPIRLRAGTRLSAEFVYDNSTANVRNPSHPPRRVTWGLGVTDEMAGLHFQVVPARESDREELGQTLWGKMMRLLGGR